MPAFCSAEVCAAVGSAAVASESGLMMRSPLTSGPAPQKESARIGREAGVECLRRIHHARAGLRGEKRCKAQYERDTTRKARTARSLNENRTGPRKKTTVPRRQRRHQG